MRFTSLKVLLLILCASFAFGADCNTSGYPCLNIDSQIKGSLWPAWGVDTGTANTYAVATHAPLGSVLKPGSEIKFIAANTNTGASTLAVNGGTAIAVVNPPTTPLLTGNIIAGDVIVVIYDGTAFQCITCSTSSGSGSGGPTFGCNTNCGYILASPDMTFLNAAANGATALSFPLSTANRAQYVRFFNNIGRTVGNACIDIINASAGGHADVGVYSVAGTTGVLRWHTGSFLTTSLGVQCFTPTAYAMAGGSNFFLSWCADNTTVTLAAIAASNGGASSSMLSAGPIHTFGVNSTDVCTAGVLPASITTTNITNTSTNMILPYVSVSN